MKNIIIQTAAGRSITFTSRAASSIEEAGIADQIDGDVDQIKAGGSHAALLGRCQDGAYEDRFGDWSDYCDAIVRTADNEMTNTKTPMITPPASPSLTSPERPTYSVEQWGAICAYAAQHGMSENEVQANPAHRQRAFAQLADADTVLIETPSV